METEIRSQLAAPSTYNWQGPNHRKCAAFPREQTPRLSPHADKHRPECEDQKELARKGKLRPLLSSFQ